MGDDLGPLAAGIAEAVVAVVMAVDQHVDVRRRLRLGGFHGRQHVAGQGNVEQGVDQQGLVAIDDQAGVGPAPAAVRLQPGVAAVAKIVQSLRVGEAAKTQ
jgi:hypothetical protein